MSSRPSSVPPARLRALGALALALALAPPASAQQHDPARLAARKVAHELRQAERASKAASVDRPSQAKVELVRRSELRAEAAQRIAEAKAFEEEKRRARAMLLLRARQAEFRRYEEARRAARFLEPLALAGPEPTRSAGPGRRSAERAPGRERARPSRAGAAAHEVRRASGTRDGTRSPLVQAPSAAEPMQRLLIEEARYRDRLGRLRRLREIALSLGSRSGLARIERLASVEELRYARVLASASADLDERSYRLALVQIRRGRITPLPDTLALAARREGSA